MATGEISVTPLFYEVLCTFALHGRGFKQEPVQQEFGEGEKTTPGIVRCRNIPHIAPPDLSENPR
jgi:hypothetical protein